MNIEQAIFTSLATDRACGYQIATRSKGLTEADARELAIWGPSHDSLLVDGPRPRTSTNFHRLASGSYCISRTQAAGPEYSGRGGEVVYTQMLVVPRDVLERFGNNPFAVLRASEARGVMRVFDRLPRELDSFELRGRAAAVDQGLLAQLARHPGGAALSALVDATLSHEQLAVRWRGALVPLVAGLFSLLPIECRLEFSFATGLKFSPSRPVRLMGVDNDEPSPRTSRHGVDILDLDRLDASEALGGWASFVREAVLGGRLSMLASQLEKRRPSLTLHELDDLAGRLGGASATRKRATVIAGPKPAPQPTDTKAEANGHAPRETLSGKEVEHLGTILASQPAEVVEKLERIDDLLFSAISGSETALGELRELWPRIAGELDSKLVEQSAKQYLRCALAICTRGASDTKRAERALAAIDVLCVLYE